MSSKPLIVSDTLYFQAESVGDVHKRSVSKQLEFWAELGKIAEQNLTRQQVDDLLHGRAKVETKPLESVYVGFNDIFNELENDRKNGTLASQVVTSSEWYRLSEKHPGFLEKINRSGDIIIGTIQDGKFIEANHFVEKNK